MYWLGALLPGLFAACLTMLLTPPAIRIAWRLRAVDVPSGRKKHARVTPRLGGIAIAAGIIAALVPSLVLLGSRSAATPSPDELLWFLLATLIVFGLGVADDIESVGPLAKLFFQILAASIVVAIGWQFTAIRLPWEARLSVSAVAPVLSVLWIVGVTNAVNFIDGLDGLAAGIVAIISSTLLIFAVFQGNLDMVIATSCIAGACLGFLRHNRKPAKIFMGDSGSLTLGFIVATISLRSGVKASAAMAILVPLLALGLPIIDTVLVMWYRFLKGHPNMNRLVRVFRGDRKHLHHLLLETHSDRPIVMVILYGIAAAFCLGALAVAASGSVWLGLGFLGVEIAAVLLIRNAGLNAIAKRLSEDRLKSLEPDADSGGSTALGTEPRGSSSFNPGASDHLPKVPTRS